MALAIFVSSALVFISCYPTSSDITASDLDTVATAFDRSVDFSLNSTYAMPDSVIHLDISGTGEKNISRVADPTILSTIAQNLQAFGYTRVDSASASDVQLLVLAVANENFDVYSSYGWWGYYGGGWYGGWGGSYPGWGWGYGWSTTYSYTIGTLVMMMIDIAEADSSAKEVPVFWVGAANGLLTGSEASLEQRVVRAIDQAFEQSPYLDVSN